MIAYNLFVAFCLIRVTKAQQPCPAIPADYAFQPFGSHQIRELPDPFLSVGGMRISRKTEWDCRQNELSQLAQAHEYGTVPGPPTSLRSSLNGTTLKIDLDVTNKTTSFTVSIKYPNSGNAPYPALIVFGSLSIPAPASAAVVIFTSPDEIARPGAEPFLRVHTGKFYDLHGRGHSAGTTAALAWSISRIIDALEQTPAALIDPKRLGITGCSRFGRATLAAGAFDTRIALTVVQEAGQGGDACYRLDIDDQSRYGRCRSMPCPSQSDYGQGAVFQNFSRNPQMLPFDQHSVAAMIAPRALLVIQNLIDWLRPKASFGCMVATHKVWEALGVPERMAVSQNGAGNHCQFPDTKADLLGAFVEKFLVGTEGKYAGFNTNVVESTTGITPSWNTWKIPLLD
ncbi:hypothetical protein OQA88_11860 [Cercophora sp. LCS_1]